MMTGTTTSVCTEGGGCEGIANDGTGVSGRGGCPGRVDSLGRIDDVVGGGGLEVVAVCSAALGMG